MILSLFFGKFSFATSLGVRTYVRSIWLATYSVLLHRPPSFESRSLGVSSMVLWFHFLLSKLFLERVRVSCRVGWRRRMLRTNDIWCVHTSCLERTKQNKNPENRKQRLIILQYSSSFHYSTSGLHYTDRCLPTFIESLQLTGGIHIHPTILFPTHSLPTITNGSYIITSFFINSRRQPLPVSSSLRFWGLFLFVVVGRW